MALEGGLSSIFDIDPSISGIEEEGLHLARYLKDRVLTIDVWNGDSLMHFGTVKVPLFMLMRQGEASKVVGHEFDICEAEHGGYVGGLQILMSNEGRRAPSKEDDDLNRRSSSPFKTTGVDLAKSSKTSQRHKKKVSSKPIENLS
jgi:hypothetical protein